MKNVKLKIEVFVENENGAEVKVNNTYICHLHADKKFTSFELEDDGVIWSEHIGSEIGQTLIRTKPAIVKSFTKTIAEAEYNLPFLINITNPTELYVDNVPVLSSESESADKKIKYTMESSGVTYIEFMKSIKDHPFDVGLIHYANDSEPLSFELNDEQIDFESTNDSSLARIEFRVDDACNLKITKLPPNSSVRIRLYPIITIEPSSSDE